ncbi:hypothetical protein CISG_07501 [Coccidioides immitis RMSCC 3703]|uniref:Fungal N-terminal domain-containing protein n=1 Tax=Coccidioides immitis RMSCC 3703 TaxID=454286 RepID=A0A0J8TYU3_COCIT|nr:hypothetical protein CISG_07501 [Coccidioides immitis RMSCC 3703]
MDPLSITASIAGVTTLAFQICSSLAELRSLSSLTSSSTAVGKAKFGLSGAYAWRKEQDTLKALQDDIRSIKCNLNILLGASNSIQAISAFTLQSSQEQVAMKDKFIDTLTTVDERITRVEQMLQTQTHQLQATQFQQVGALYNVRRTNRRQSRSRPNNPTVTTPNSEGLAVRVSPYVVSCRSDCRCSCHKQQKSSTPALLNRVFGQLFIGYAGLPFVSPKCDIESCRKSQASQVSLEYWFPLGFFSSTIVRMQLGHHHNMGSLFHLDTLTRVPDSAQCVNLAVKGDIDGLKHLFTHGLASPRDVSTSRGYSLLRWALYAKQYDTCEFLIYAGADPDYRPLAGSDNSPRIKACHFLLEGGLPDQGVVALKTITKGSYFEDFIEDSNFTQIHRVVLGLSLLDLEDEITFSYLDLCLMLQPGVIQFAFASYWRLVPTPIHPCQADNYVTTSATNHASISIARQTPRTLHHPHRPEAPFNAQEKASRRYIQIFNTDQDILAGTEHFRLRSDRQYTLGDFKSRLLKRPDVTENLAFAFDELLDIINHMPDTREGTESILEAGFYSCTSSPIVLEDGQGFERLARRFFPCLSSSDSDSDQNIKWQSWSDESSNDNFQDALEDIHSESKR